MANKKAFIIGIGQDGFYMNELLESKGYDVYKMTRSDTALLPLYIETICPHEIYNFAGISNVINPYENTEELFEVTAGLPQIILETIARVDKKIKFFQASSSLIFGRDNNYIQNEQTPFAPMYIYGCAKLYAHNLVNEFRETYGLFACSGIFFPHESPRRKEHFFSSKICKAAATKTKVHIGSLDAERDFGYAKEYVQAAYLMMQAKEPRDYVIGTGILTSLKDFARKAFEYVGLDYREYVITDESLVRKNDTGTLRADITAIKKDLGWYPKTNIDELIKIMVDAYKPI